MFNANSAVKGGGIFAIANSTLSLGGVNHSGPTEHMSVEEESG